MHDTAHIMMNLDIVTSAWLIDFCHKAIWPCGLKSLSRNFMADIRISLRNTRSQILIDFSFATTQQIRDAFDPYTNLPYIT